MEIENLEKEIKEKNSKISILRKNFEELNKEYDSLENSVGEEILKDKLGNFYPKDAKVERKEKNSFVHYSCTSEIVTENKEIILEILKSIEDDGERLITAYFLHQKDDGIFGGEDRFFGTTPFGCYEPYGLNGNTNPPKPHQKMKEVIEDLNLMKYIFVDESDENYHNLPLKTRSREIAKLIEKKYSSKKKSLVNKITEIEEEFVALKKSVVEEEKLLKVYKHLVEENVDYKSVQESMPGLVRIMEQILDKKQELRGVDIDIDRNVAAFVTKESSYLGGSSGIAVDAVLHILKKGQEVKTERFSYRDPHCFSGDKPELNFYDVKIRTIKESEGLSVILKSQNSNKYGNKIVCFNFKENKDSLGGKINVEEKEGFEKQIRGEVEIIIDENYKKGKRMPLYILFRGHEGQISDRLLNSYKDKDSDKQVPYEKPTLVGSRVSEDGLEAIVIIKAQIDYSTADGKEYAFLAYKITPEETTFITKETISEFKMEYENRFNDDGAADQIKAEELFNQIS